MIIIDITGRCNLKCIHCYSSPFENNELNSNEIMSALNRLPSDVDICIMGGEPFLHNNVFEILSESVNSGHKTSIVTNGTLLTNEKIEKLLTIGVEEITLSLDGYSAETNDFIRGKNSFYRCLSSLKRINKAIAENKSSLKLSVSITVGSYNIDYIIKILELLDTQLLYLHKVWIQPVLFLGRAAENKNMSVSETEWVELCDKICSIWTSLRRFAFLSIPNPEYTIRFLMKKHNILLTDSVANCPAMDGSLTGRILPNGFIVPCIGRPDLLNELEKQESFYNPLHISNFVWSEKSNLFESFTSALSKYRKRIDQYCEGCLYLDSCDACPLENWYKAKPRVWRHECCKKAKQIENFIDQKIRIQDSKKYRYRNNMLDVNLDFYEKELNNEGLILFSSYSERYIVLNRIQSCFWDSIKKYKNFTDAISNTLTQTISNNQYSIKDIFSCFHALEKMGIISVEGE